MFKAEDLTGRKFGRWTVIERAASRKGKTAWKCACDCGTVRDVIGYNLTSGHSKSCGCLTDEARHNKAVHMGCNDRLYHVWTTMKQRCMNPKNNNYKNYGARGITVCDEWVHDYAAFRKWAYENGYDDTAERFACTIDRIDVNGNYSPDNCRWVNDYSIQVKNRRPYEYASHRKSVLRIANDGTVTTFQSIREAARRTTGNVKSASSISACCRGDRVSAYGYKWQLKEDQMQIDIYDTTTPMHVNPNQITRVYEDVGGTYVMALGDGTEWDIEKESYERILKWMEAE